MNKPDISFRFPNSRTLGFTLVEILTVLAIVAVLAALAFPVILKMQERARIAKSTSNLRAISQAALLMAAENNGSLPYEFLWAPGNAFSLAPYLSLPDISERKASIFTCPLMHSSWPALRTPYYSTYAANTFATRWRRNSSNSVSFSEANMLDAPRPHTRQEIERPSEMFFLTNAVHFVGNEESGYYYPERINRFSFLDAAEERFAFRGGQIFSFMDGHIEILSMEEIQQRSQTSESAFWQGTRF